MYVYVCMHLYVCSSICVSCVCVCVCMCVCGHGSVIMPRSWVLYQVLAKNLSPPLPPGSALTNLGQGCMYLQEHQLCTICGVGHRVDMNEVVATT